MKQEFLKINSYGKSCKSLDIRMVHHGVGREGITEN